MRNIPPQSPVNTVNTKDTKTQEQELDERGSVYISKVNNQQDQNWRVSFVWSKTSNCSSDKPIKIQPTDTPYMEQVGKQLINKQQNKFQSHY